MKLVKYNQKLDEAIEAVGYPVEREMADEVQAVMPVSYTGAVEAVKKWRAAIDKLLKERTDAAFDAIDAKDSDRFKHMSDKDMKFNSGEKVSLNEALEATEECCIPEDEEYRFECFMNDLMQALQDILAKYSEVDNIEVEIVSGEDEGTGTPLTEDVDNEGEETVEEITTEGPEVTVYTSETLPEFMPWGSAEATWQTIQDDGKMEELQNLVLELYPEGIDEQTLNDLLMYDADFVYDALGMEVEE